MASELRQRIPGPAVDVPAPASIPTVSVNGKAKELHPGGRAKHGRFMAAARSVTWAIYFLTSSIAIHTTQLIGGWLYWVNKEWFYAYMSLTKQSFGILITTMTHWWAPTKIRISADASVASQIRLNPDGLVEFLFPERLVLIANHQIYTDWLYLWWVAYANSPHMHGFIYIILKESLKYVPILGPGVMFYGFIFMSRKMATDQPRLEHRLRKLSQLHKGPDGTEQLDPMWLLLFPEGTNASKNGRARSKAWSDKIGMPDMQHVLQPRSTGMYFCLQELRKTVAYVYDCTVAYEGIPRGEFGQDYFTLTSTFFEGRPPKSVNFYWRRFRIADIPLSTPEEFEQWLRKRWYEKDALVEEYVSTGRLPATPGWKVNEEGHEKSGADADGFIETEVRTEHWWEVFQMFAVLGIVAILARLGWSTFWSVREGLARTFA